MSIPGIRIIAGDWRGRKLVSPKGDVTRPTASRAREALFSMLVSRMGGMTGLHVADFYAGSGALGLEALSRGAAHCLFVERDRAALDALNANIAALAVGDRTTVRAAIVGAAGASVRPIDLALFDPPYGETGIDALLTSMGERSWFAEGAWLSVETGHDQNPAPSGFTVDVRRDVGKARITLLQFDSRLA